MSLVHFAWMLGLYLFANQWLFRIKPLTVHFQQGRPMAFPYKATKSSSLSAGPQVSSRDPR